MSRDIIELGSILRKQQRAQALKMIEPEIASVREDYERQIADRDAQLAEKDAELARLEAENQSLREALAQAEPPARTRKRKAK